jgi:phospholipid/cholesterol/gamma-HCH transport system substrate-binding protein
MRRLRYIVVGSIGVAVFGAAVYFGVRLAYGAYDDYYYVTADLPRAGQQLLEQADVRTKGVDIGSVTDISLVDRRARLELQIESDYKIPKDVVLEVELKTALGAKYVDLEYDPDAGGPFLQNGDRITDAHVGPELEDLLEDGVRIFEAIDPGDLGTIIHELARGARGHGDDIARGIVANRDLSDTFAATLRPQLQSLEDFEILFAELEDRGIDLNGLADAINEGVPVYASARAQAELRRALEALVPFADDFADLLIFNRRQWDRMMNSGDKVLATIASRPGGLENLVHGLYRYVYKLGQPIAPFFVMEDGSAGAGFTAFFGGNDQDEEFNQICDAFPPEDRKHIPFCSGGGP